MKTNHLQNKVEQLLYGSHGLNLKRPDIAALAGHQSTSGPVKTLREIEEVMLYMLDVIKESRDKFKDTGHWSSCALHNGPAFEPKPCDCGVDPSMTPELYGSEFPNDVSSFKLTNPTNN